MRVVCLREGPQSSDHIRSHTDNDGTVVYSEERGLLRSWAAGVAVPVRESVGIHQTTPHDDDPPHHSAP